MSESTVKKQGNCIFSHSSLDTLRTEAERIQDSLNGAPYDGPNESKEQKKSRKQLRRTQQPADPFQGAVNNQEGTLGNALRGKSPDDQLGALASRVAGELDQLSGTLSDSLNHTVHDNSVNNLWKTVNDQQNKINKSGDGANDEERADVASTYPPGTSTATGGMMDALKGVFGHTDTEDESVVSRATESRGDIGAELAAATTNVLEGAGSPGKGEDNANQPVTSVLEDPERSGYNEDHNAVGQPGVKSDAVDS